MGPEQNFTYIAALKPKMVFITDVRRGNLHMHLMYKAMFELSKDRADFIELLFNKKRPAGLTEKSTATDLANAFWDVTTSSEDVYKANLKRIQDHLTKTHGLPLEPGRSGRHRVHLLALLLGRHAHQLQLVVANANNGRGGNTMAIYGDLMLAHRSVRRQPVLPGQRRVLQGT